MNDFIISALFMHCDLIELTLLFRFVEIKNKIKGKSAFDRVLFDRMLRFAFPSIKRCIRVVALLLLVTHIYCFILYIS